MVRTFSESVQLLQSGQCLIYPTETFFALGCSIDHADAIERVFTAKNRLKHKPLPLIAATWEQVEKIAFLDSCERELAEQFWPGPLTFLCKAREHLNANITAGSGKVAVRISSHPIALGLAYELKTPLVCSSANISSKPAPRLTDDLDPVLLQKVPHVLALGPLAKGGEPSSIIEFCGKKKLIMHREGAIKPQQLIEKGWEVSSYADV